MHHVAFYDLDRTVTRLPTWFAFLVSSAPRWRVAFLPAMAGMWLAYTLGLIRRDRLKELMHRLMLGGAVRGDRMAALAERFADRTFNRNIRPGAPLRIAGDRAEGYRVVLATAAHRFYAEALARRLGITDVVATDASVNAAGAILHRLAGPNLYGPAKLAAVEAWLRAGGIERGAARLRFYTDHVSDAPCLNFVDEPFAVNPHRRLRALASACGWPVLDWRPAAAAQGL
ncbi:HAD family hydrolase [Sphingomonas aracearum]|uniref:HAD-IB family hydrolase n=1 Tax=Sphingomonas aracearum TaxID=2283317 RepID=A0A369VTH7_9SPHN|nr:HAD-IB family hydrolase [Sphingomonas aracearum]RDE05688.1 HAD-IB family hydrolase [Sphingomonas aracearum]